MRAPVNIPALKLYWRKRVMKSVTAFWIVEHPDIRQQKVSTVVPVFNITGMCACVTALASIPR